MYRIYCYAMATGRTSVLPMVYRSENDAYAVADTLNDRDDAFAKGLCFCVMRVSRMALRRAG